MNVSHSSMCTFAHCVIHQRELSALSYNGYSMEPLWLFIHLREEWSSHNMMTQHTRMAICWKNIISWIILQSMMMKKAWRQRPSHIRRKIKNYLSCHYHLISKYNVISMVHQKFKGNSHFSNHKKGHNWFPSLFVARSKRCNNPFQDIIANICD